MNWIRALKMLSNSPALQALLDCPAVQRVGAEVLVAIADAIANGLEDRAARLAREAAQSRTEGQAAGRSASASSIATTERMRRR